MSRAAIALLASHEGSLMQAVIDACEGGRLDATVRLVISNNSRAGALARAAKSGIASVHMSRQTHGDDERLDQAMKHALQRAEVDLVVLAGYMRPVGEHTLKAFPGRIINCHPALLPKYGGQGFYGQRVHRAVLDAGDTETGSTIHHVDEVYDRGPIIVQNCISVLPGDTVEALEARVKASEHELLIQAIDRIMRT